MTVTFSLTNSTTLRFGISGNVISDDGGGVSLLITKQSIDDTNATQAFIQTASNQAVRVSWTPQAGQRYQALWSPSLATNSWLPLGIPHAASGVNDSALDYTTNQSPRFYRVFRVQRISEDSPNISRHQKDRLTAFHPRNIRKPATL